jgi:hypothetical protein
MLREIYISDKVGGGDITVDIGIVRDPMIRAGVIIVVIHLGMEEYLLIGEVIIETIPGVVVLGILITSITVILIIIGVVVIGVMTMEWDVLAVVRVDVTYMAIIDRLDAPIPMGK